MDRCSFKYFKEYVAKDEDMCQGNGLGARKAKGAGITPRIPIHVTLLSPKKGNKELRVHQHCALSFDNFQRDTFFLKLPPSPVDFS